ncbi:MAG: hypothetical protein R3E79_22550 [Caldilineaceae bacterium]
MAQRPEGDWFLIQVCVDLSNPTTREREVRALDAARADYPHATPLLLTLDAIPPQPSLPVPIQWQAATAWLLES